MSILYSCDGCGKCDDCQGITYLPPADRKPLTDEQRKMLVESARKMGEAFARIIGNEARRISESQ